MPRDNGLPGGLSLDIIVFSEIHSAALCYLSLEHSQLLAYCQIFEIRGSQRPIKPMQKGYEEQDENLSHGREALRPITG